MVQLLAASACRGQFSSSMPESYSSSADSLAGALKFKQKLQFETQTTRETLRAQMNKSELQSSALEEYFYLFIWM